MKRINGTEKIEKDCLFEGLKITHQLLTALEELHSMELCHQDIAPENVVVTIDDSSGQINSVKIVDIDCLRKQVDPNNPFDVISTGKALIRVEREEGVTSCYPSEYFADRTIKGDIAAVGVLFLMLLQGNAWDISGIQPIRTFKERLNQTRKKFNDKSLGEGQFAP